jgi:L,D-transpeptidase YbiS
METVNDSPIKRRNVSQWIGITFLSIILACSVVICCFYQSQPLKDLAFSIFDFPAPKIDSANVDSTLLAKQITASKKQIANLQKQLDAYSPKGPYLIINSTSNNFVLRTKETVIREGICSTGSNTLLDAGEDQQWMFRTPKGHFKVLTKIIDPVWRKPNWAFVEEGLPIPPKDHPSRFEPGTLGDYALTLGQGYLIHGTLYTRFLGMPVTHGCIRLGDEDLAVVYKKLNPGSIVYIF